MLMQEVACFKSLQSRRFEARRGLGEAWARPGRGLGEARRGLGEATPRTQNVLAQGQSEAHGDSKLYNTIVEVPGRLNFFFSSSLAVNALWHGPDNDISSEKAVNSTIG